LILKLAEAILREYPLCDSCLGRQFGNLLTGLSNSERGHAIKLSLAMEAHSRMDEDPEEAIEILSFLAYNGAHIPAVESLQKMGIEVRPFEKCFLCNNFLSRTREIAKKCLNRVKDYEFHTFLVGAKVTEEVLNKEEELSRKFSLKFSESIKSEISREIGKEIERISGKGIDRENPDIVFIVGLSDIEVQINPLYIYGRYRKLKRGIPQTRWPCSNCKGRGCELCGWTGKQYPESVEELIGKPALEMTKGKEVKLHGAGREDIDVRTLGSGRPFILEIKRPKLRKINLGELEKRINSESKGKVEVLGLRFSSKSEVKKIKEKRGRKRYRVVFKLDREIKEEDLEKLENLKGRILQRTPTRVLHRRADKFREREVYEIVIKEVKGNVGEAEIYCEGGLYVKELVSGDNGRTTPSFTEVLGSKAECLELDVLDIELEGE